MLRARLTGQAEQALHRPAEQADWMLWPPMAALITDAAAPMLLSPGTVQRMTAGVQHLLDRGWTRERLTPYLAVAAEEQDPALRIDRAREVVEALGSVTHLDPDEVDRWVWWVGRGNVRGTVDLLTQKFRRTADLWRVTCAPGQAVIEAAASLGDTAAHTGALYWGDPRLPQERSNPLAQRQSVWGRQRQRVAIARHPLIEVLRDRVYGNASGEMTDQYNTMAHLLSAGWTLDDIYAHVHDSRDYVRPLPGLAGQQHPTDRTVRLMSPLAMVSHLSPREFAGWREVVDPQRVLALAVLCDQIGGPSKVLQPAWRGTGLPQDMIVRCVLAGLGVAETLTLQAEGRLDQAGLQVLAALAGGT